MARNQYFVVLHEGVSFLVESTRTNPTEVCQRN